MSSVREVARLAGVSPATVSRVINGTANVNPDKRRRVLEVIEQTEFVPNEVARSLFKRSANIIGLIIPSIRNPYFTQMASVIDEVAKECGFRLFLCNVGDDLEQERAAIQMLTAMNVDGIIIGTTKADIQRDLRLCRVPVVVLDTLFETKYVNHYVYCDYYQGGRMAMEHLLACGCKNIVCIRGPREVFSADTRYQGYRDVCRERGIPEQVVECDYDFDAGLAMTEELLKTYPDVDGVMACNDIVAISTYKILHKKKIPVPEQIQLIGFDDITFASLLSPELTTIHQPMQEMARKAAELILASKNEPKEGQRVVFPVSLVERETTKKSNKIYKERKREDETSRYSQQ